MKLRIDYIKEGDESIADKYQDRLIELHGQQRGVAIQYAEAFQLSEYGRQVSIEKIKALFPTFE